MKQLFNPFEKHGEKALLSAGLVVGLVGSLLGYIFHARFDGVLDIHFTSEVYVYQPFLDNLVNLLSLTLFLYAAGKIVNSKTRFIDILGACTIARTPIYLLPLFNIDGFISGATSSLIDPETLQLVDTSPGTLVPILVFSFFTILFLVWYITLLYNGFKVSSHAKNTRSVILFILAVLLAEVLSKYLILQFV